MFRLGCGSCLVIFLCDDLFISGTHYSMHGGVLFVCVQVVGLFISSVLISLTQAWMIICVARFWIAQHLFFPYS